MTEAKAGHTEMAVAAVLKMRAKKMWASAMTAAVAKASPQMVDKLEPPLQELIKKHVLRKKLAHDVQKCFTPLQVTSCSKPALLASCSCSDASQYWHGSLVSAQCLSMLHYLMSYRAVNTLLTLKDSAGT